jgi:hypothetical protein
MHIVLLYLQGACDSVLPLLLEKLGDSNPRLSSAAKDSIMYLAGVAVGGPSWTMLVWTYAAAKMGSTNWPLSLTCLALRMWASPVGHCGMVSMQPVCQEQGTSTIRCSPVA